MAKRPPAYSGPGGYSPANASMAPPLPPGPAPPMPSVAYNPGAPGPSTGAYNSSNTYNQGGGGVVDGSAQHAAAWAAYYQGVDPSAAYAAGSSSTAPNSANTTGNPPGAAGPTNPYSNYGYGAGAQHQHTSYGQGGGRPPHHQQQHQQQQQNFQQPAQNYQYQQPNAQGQYGGMQGQGQGGYQPPQGGYNAAQGQGNYGYGGVNQPPQQQQQLQPGGFQQNFQPARPPFQQQPPSQQGGGQNFGWNNQQQGQGQGFNNNFRPNNAPTGGGPGFNGAPQGFQPNNNNNNFNGPGPSSSFRPPGPGGGVGGPSGTPPRPFQPSLNGRPPRPPSAAPSNFPPAKRPRFDGPNQQPHPPRPSFGGPSSSPGPPGGPIRPPRPPAFNNGAGAGPAGAIPMRPPIRPPTTAPPPPIQRPPIHLGLGGPPPNLGPNLGGPRGAPLGPSRGPSGVGPPRGRGGGVMGAPKGPSGRNVRSGSALRPGGGGGGDRERDRREREKEKDRESARRKDRERDRERDMKTTMTDFRIVGVRISGLGAGASEDADGGDGSGGVWEWGLVEDKATDWNEATEPEVKEESKPKVENEETEVKVEELPTAPTNGDETTAPDPSGDGSSSATAEQVSVKEEEKEDAGPDTNGDVAEQASTDADKREESAEAEKRGEKRKAKTPEIDDESIPSKRPSYPAVTPIAVGAASLPPKPSFLNTSTPTATQQTALPSSSPSTSAPSTATAAIATAAPKEPKEPAAPVPKYENSQNRFRIYFESPPELDRIPKAVRRGNKRWRRESSSVAPLPLTSSSGHLGDPALAAASSARGSSAAPSGVDGETDAVAEVSEEAEGLLEEVVAELAEGQVAEGDPQPSEEPAGTATETVDTNGTEVPAIEVTEELVTGKEGQGASTNDAGATDPALTAGIEQEEAADNVPAESEETAGEPTLADEAAVGDSGADMGDVSMRTDTGELNIIEEETSAIEPTVDTADVAEAPTSADVLAEGSVEQGADTNETNGTTEPVILSAQATAELQAQLEKSAEATASAYKTRTRRRSSVSSVDSTDYPAPSAVDSEDHRTAVPSTNRISVLFEESSRRICLDANVVEHVAIYRGEGKIVVRLNREAFLVGGEDGVEDDGPEEASSALAELPKGVLVETYDPVDQRFVSLPRSKLDEIHAGSPEDASSIPPFQKALSTSSSEAEPLELTVYLNKRKALSEPKWCRNNSADEWLFETFGSRKAMNLGGWRGKLEIVDPDPAPTLSSILDSWVSSSSSGTPADRRSFTSSLLADPNDLLEILLRLTRGERNPSLSSSPSPGFGALASAIRPDSPYASHQTHVSLAILAMYRLTTDYATRAGEGELVKEKIADIVRSLPVGMISKSLDGLFKEWGEKI